MNPKARFFFFASVVILVTASASSLLTAKLLESEQKQESLLEKIELNKTPPSRTGPLGGFSEIIEQAAPAVVSITSSSYVPVGRDRRTGEIYAREIPGSLGSGVIISSDGYVLTNAHVISQGNRIMDRVFVRLSDEREFEAQVIGVDRASDIAVLDLDATNLPAAVLGDSDLLKPGDIVLAIGSPFGLSETVTSGIVSAVGRTNLNLTSPIADEEFIQTDASINPGNSGGCLVDNQGRVIGINTAIFSQSGGNVGIGFAIPISKAIRIADQLVSYGEVRRGYLGIAPEQMTRQLALAADQEGLSLPEQGILVWRIEPNTPAAKSGMQRHDVIIAINGEPVTERQDFQRKIARFIPGTEVLFQIVRDGEEMELSITLEAR